LRGEAWCGKWSRNRRVDRSVRVGGVLCIFVRAGAIDVGGLGVFPDGSVRASVSVNEGTTREVGNVGVHLRVVVVERGRSTTGGSTSGSVHHGAVRVEDRDGRRGGARALLESLLAPAAFVLVVGELLLERAHEPLGKLVPRGLLVRGHRVPFLAKELGQVAGAQVRVVKCKFRATDTHVNEVDCEVNNGPCNGLPRDSLFIGRRGV